MKEHLLHNIFSPSFIAKFSCTFMWVMHTNFEFCNILSELAIGPHFIKKYKVFPKQDFYFFYTFIEFSKHIKLIPKLFQTHSRVLI